MEQIPRSTVNESSTISEKVEDELLLTTNTMQAQLSDLMGTDFVQWIRTYAARFREVINDHPEMITEYERNPDKILHAIILKLNTEDDTDSIH